MNIIDKIPERTDDQLKIMRRNAKAKLDDPKTHDYASEVLDAIDRELGLRHIPGMIVTFREQHPDGFYGDQETRDERDYKLQASTEFLELLGRDEYKKLLATGSYSKLEKRVVHLVQLTNFIQGSFEKPVLLDAIKANSVSYLNALFDFVWGTDEIGQRFDRFVEFSEKLKRAKWTYVTYFLFLSDPENHMFVKPDMLKRSLQISQYPWNTSRRRHMTSTGRFLNSASGSRPGLPSSSRAT